MPRDATDPPDLVHVPVEVLVGMNAMVVYQAQIDTKLQQLGERIERLDGKLDGHIREVGPAISAFGEFARSATSHAMANAAEAAGAVLAAKAEAETAKEAARIAEEQRLAAEKQRIADAKRDQTRFVGAVITILTLLAAAVADKIVDRFNLGESRESVQSP